MPPSAKKGKVYLVGAGPGDPRLLTLRARDLLEEADVVLTDRLVGDGILALVPPEKRVDVGRAPEDERSTAQRQAEIHARLVELARAGKAVVRLKGGDPFVFGRGGEEVEALRAAGVDVEVVPGVSSAVACPAALQIPLTHRNHASLVTVVTGREGEGSAPPVDWDALARLGGTLVVLMGVGSLGDYVDRLRAAGLPDDTPVAIVERGTLPEQRAVRGTLGDVVRRAQEAELRSPAVVVIGSVADLARDDDAT